MRAIGKVGRGSARRGDADEARPEGLGRKGMAGAARMAPPRERQSAFLFRRELWMPYTKYVRIATVIQMKKMW